MVMPVTGGNGRIDSDQVIWLVEAVDLGRMAGTLNRNCQLKLGLHPNSSHFTSGHVGEVTAEINAKLSSDDRLTPIHERVRCIARAITSDTHVK